MPPLLLILWLVFAAAAALVTPKAHALDGTVVKPLEMLGTTYEQVHVRTPALTSVTPGGIRVARQADALIRASAARTLKLPLTAAATLSKSRMTAGAAGLCIAFPPRCIGSLALGLGAQIALSQLTGLLEKTSQTYTATGNVNSVNLPPNYNCTATATRDGCLSELLGVVQSRAGAIAVAQSGPLTVGAVTNSWSASTIALNTTYSQSAFLYRANGTLYSGNPVVWSWRATGVGPVQTAPATPADINQAFTTNSASWQDSSFAAVFADAVTKGATWPITTFDGAEMVAGPADAVATETQTITSPAGTMTRTTTTTATAVTSGTTIADAKAVITQRTTTTEMGPGGTTTTETETAPELENSVTLQPNSGTVTPPAEVTVNVEFPEPVFTDTALPEVPDLYEQKYPNGLAGVWAEKSPQLMATTFVTSVKAMFPTLSDSGSCPTWMINLDFGAMGNFGSGDLAPPCWIRGVISLIFLTTACFTAWWIIFG